MPPLSVRLGLLSSCLLAACTVAGCAGSSSGDKDAPTGPGASRSPDADGPDAITDKDFDAIRELMDDRARALREGRRPAFLATLDPGNRMLRVQQETFFDNVQALPVDKLYYGVDSNGLVADKVTGKGTTLRPPLFEHVSLRGVFDEPVSNQISITFVERDGTWLVGGETVADDFKAQERPWFGGPIEVAQDDGLLAVTDADSDVSSDSVLASAQSDLAAVADVLDEPAREQLLVDASSNGLVVELSNASGENAGAVSFNVVSTDLLGDESSGVAGAVIKLNPEIVEQLVDDSVTMRHELTHFMLDRYGPGNPQWATEGIAEYVAHYPTLLSQLVAPDEVLDLIRASDVELTPAGTWGSDPTIDYLSARATAEHLVQTYGLERYLEMMDIFERRASNVLHGEGIVDEVLEKVYGVGERSVARGTFDLLEGLAG